uniref:Uncharacterized protein n=1 Tax=Anguilla anguilla TaxID=7936 RepID=A0A0E9W121_ANGAN
MFVLKNDSSICCNIFFRIFSSLVIFSNTKTARYYPAVPYTRPGFSVTPPALNFPSFF